MISKSRSSLHSREYLISFSLENFIKYLQFIFNEMYSRCFSSTYKIRVQENSFHSSSKKFVIYESFDDATSYFTVFICFFTFRFSCCSLLLLLFPHQVYSVPWMPLFILYIYRFFFESSNFFSLC